MAPEQITGEDVDERADLFAFGCVLYEMASGSCAFGGKNLPEVLHRLANEEPGKQQAAARGNDHPRAGHLLDAGRYLSQPGRRAHALNRTRPLSGAVELHQRRGGSGPGYPARVVVEREREV